MRIIIETEGDAVAPAIKVENANDVKVIDAGSPPQYLLQLTAEQLAGRDNAPASEDAIDAGPPSPSLEAAFRAVASLNSELDEETADLAIADGGGMVPDFPPPLVVSEAKEVSPTTDVEDAIDAGSPRQRL
ncbi:MAG: hypothetical protein AB4050_08400 [Synechococcus sp.]